jgi:plastocyanin
MRMTYGIPTAILLLAAAACGGEGPSTDFNVAVTPTTAELFSVAPGNTVSLTAVATDDDGQVLSGGTRTFTSGNGAIASVSDAGVVTAVGAGTTAITTSVTLDGTTVSATTAITVEDAPVTATVRAPAFVFSPGTVDVEAGGSVTWTIEAIHHAVDFTTNGAPANVPELLNASASRIFPVSGTYAYECPFHAQMSGVVRVH